MKFTEYIIPFSSEQPRWHCVVRHGKICMNKVMRVAVRICCLLQREVSLSLNMLSLF